MQMIQAKTDYIKGALIGLIVLFVLLAAETAITTLLVGSMPTDLFIYPLRHLDFYKILWASSPWETIKLLLIDKAVLVVEHRDATNGIQIWGLYYYALNMLLHCLVGLLAGVGWALGQFRKTGRPLLLFVAGSFLLIFANSHVYLASCCSAGPGWIVDVWLLSRVYDPFASSYWLELYQSVEGLFLITQAILTAIGTVLILSGWVLSRR